jgi:DNA invertase Pin-like site-specific DNA recombinase
MVVVHSMDRLACNLDDLWRLVQDLTQRGVRITLRSYRSTSGRHAWSRMSPARAFPF